MGGEGSSVAEKPVVPPDPSQLSGQNRRLGGQKDLCHLVVRASRLGTGCAGGSVVPWPSSAATSGDGSMERMVFLSPSRKCSKRAKLLWCAPHTNLIRWCGRLTTSGRGTCRGNLEGLREVEEEPRSMPSDEVQQLLHRWGLDRSRVRLALWEAGLWLALVATVAHLRPHLRHLQWLRL